MIKRLSAREARGVDDADVAVLSKEEARKFEDAALRTFRCTGKHHLPGLYGAFLLHTGLRCGELLALRWGDVTEDGFISIRKSRSLVRNRNDFTDERRYKQIEKSTKNQKARKIQLLPNAREILELIRQESAHTGREDLVCVTRNGGPNSATNLEHCMASLYRKAGILDGKTGSLHILRRTFGTELYDRTKDIKLVAAYLGDLESTVAKYYVAAREKVVASDGSVEHVIRIQ